MLQATSYRLQAKSKGSVLLLSLLVLSGVMVTGFAIGDLLLGDFREARRVDEAVGAYYSAEAGIEEGLFQIRKTASALGDINVGGTLPNGSNYNLSVSDAVPAIIAFLDRNDYLTVDFYDPDDFTSGSGIDLLTVAWEDTCGGCSWIEVGFVEWTPQAAINWTENFINFRYPRASSPVTLAGLDSSQAYRFRITAHYGDIRNLTLNAFTGNSAAPTPTSIRHAIITMTSVGNFGRSSQTLRATFSRQAPLQKIFDFVGFTECPIVKGGPVICP